jgi:4-carboxymuconolactone decarboxylase
MLRLLSVDDSARLGEQLGIVDWLATANIFRGLLHSPSAASAVYGAIDALIWHNTVAARTRELVILRIGWRAGSEYVFCNHVRISRELGIADEDILGVRDPEGCRAYSETDRLVIRLADELHESVDVTPATWSTLEHSFTLEELVELVLVAGFWRAIAGFVNTARTELDADTPSWPGGKRPTTSLTRS